MDVPYAWSDLGRIAARAAILCGPEGVKQSHPAACCLDGDRIGIHVSDGGHDVIELRIAHMGVNAGGISNRTGGQPEARDCPAQVVLPIRMAKRQTLAERRFVNLN